ncbi:hypothetical protein BH09BAC1_BH09BAC1_27400 [soil metagenome]
MPIKIAFLLMALLLSPILVPAQKAVHVYVALCDNIYQGIR